MKIINKRVMVKKTATVLNKQGCKCHYKVKDASSAIVIRRSCGEIPKPGDIDMGNPPRKPR